MLINQTPSEVFDPVLCVLRYRRSDLDTLLKSNRNTGFGLVLGVDTRIDEAVDFVVSYAHDGNIYVGTVSAKKSRREAGLKGSSVRVS